MASDVGNIIDRAIGYFNPAAGRRRLFERLLYSRAYEAASPRDPWKPRRSGASANADHFADAAALRTKARYLVQNVPYIAAGLEADVSNVIGTGIVPRSTATRQADVTNTLFAEWATVCDADGRMDLYGIQAAAYRAMEQDGEVLLRLRPRFSTDPYPVPLQLQLLEIDWLDSSRTTGGMGGNEVVNGIEYDALGKVVAYWLWDQHPGDITLRRGLRLQSSRVPAERIIHLYDAARPGQGRGITRLAPVITRVRDTQLYEDAELARKNLESRLSVLASGDVSAMANPPGYGEAADPAAARRTGELGQLASGGITELPPGVNVTVVEPKPSGGYGEFVKHQLHMIAAGAGWTYEMMTGDVSEVNFSSARIRLIEYRRGAERRQWVTFIPRFMVPIWRAFIDAAQLAGKIPRADYSVRFSTPKWDYVNPVDDVKAETAAIAAGLTSISACIRARSEEPDTVFEELQSDFERLKANGVLDVLLLLQKGKTTSEGAAAPSDAKTTT